MPFFNLVAADRRRQPAMPVVLQLTNEECGAACLAMIAGGFGAPMSVSACRGLIEETRGGVTAQALAAAARALGLAVEARALPAERVTSIGLPAIAHWQGNHFVVIEHCSPDSITIVDPASGRRRLSLAAFRAGFSGVALSFRAPPEGLPALRSRPPLWRASLAGLLSLPRVAGLLTGGIGLSLLLQILGLALPILVALLVDTIIPGRSGAVLPLLGGGLLLIVGNHALLSYWRSRVLITLQIQLDQQLMPRFFRHLLRLPLRSFQQRSSGDLMLRLGSNATIREILTAQITSTILDGGLALVYMALVLAMAPVFGLVILGSALLQMALLAHSAPALQQLAQEELAAHTDEQSYLLEALTGIAYVKSAGLEAPVFARWARLFDQMLLTSRQRSRAAARLDTLVGTIAMAVPLLLLWLGAQAVVAGTMALGTMLAINLLATSALLPLHALLAQTQQVQLLGAYLQRIADVMDLPPEQGNLAGCAAPPLRGGVQLTGVSVAYAPGDPAVLRDLTFAIEPGQCIALVGPSGAGKSTLARALLGLVPLAAGQIAYDGHPLDRMEYQTLRCQIGVVPQEIVLFSGTIRQNIALHNPDIELGEIIQAAQLALIHDDILRLPMGYDTLLTEGSASLSGGQRQRLALARALVHRPALLILDEATSHLDLATERLIQQSLAGLKCTRIVISHRLNTIQHADRIIVLSQGRVIEQGTHQQLIAAGGLYSHLFV